MFKTVQFNVSHTLKNQMHEALQIMCDGQTGLITGVRFCSW